jgi:hypothetical protein
MAGESVFAARIVPNHQIARIIALFGMSKLHGKNHAFPLKAAVPAAVQSFLTTSYLVDACALLE